VTHTMSRCVNVDGDSNSNSNSDGAVGRVSRGRGRGRSIRGSATAKVNSCARDDWRCDHATLVL
jgi:hypothetical protein